MLIIKRGKESMKILWVLVISFFMPLLVPACKELPFEPFSLGCSVYCGTTFLCNVTVICEEHATFEKSKLTLITQIIHHINKQLPCVICRKWHFMDVEDHCIETFDQIEALMLEGDSLKVLCSVSNMCEHKKIVDDGHSSGDDSVSTLSTGNKHVTFALSS